MKKRLVFLVSGSGTNMQTIIDAVSRGEINAFLAGVISSNYQAYAIGRAVRAGLPVQVLSIHDYMSPSVRDEKLLQELKKLAPDYILTLGYLGILPGGIIDEFEGRIINIHPSLLPRHGGKGYYGLKVHESVLAAGDKETGATVHLVTRDTDAGPIIRQARLKVLPEDTPESLQRRVLDNCEHPLLLSVVKDLCDDKISVEGGKVVFTDEKRQ